MKYFAFFVFMLTGCLAFSQVVYHNINPDSQIQVEWFQTSYYNFSTDEFANDTLRFSLFSDSERLIYARGYGNMWFVKNAEYDNVDTVSIGSMIDNTLSYRQQTAQLSNFYVYDSQCNGAWCNVTSKFLGFRIKEGTNIYYGWLRMSTNQDNNCLIVHDYAIQLTPGIPIAAGEGLPIFAENLMLTDESNHRNASDINLTFTSSMLWEQVNQYRVMIVPADLSEDFSLDAAIEVENDRYFMITPSSDAFSGTLPETLPDVFGNEIAEFIPYRVVILSVSSNSAEFPDVLSEPSPELTLSSPCVSITQLQANSEYLGGTAYNIQVSFDKPEAEQGISGYYLLFVAGDELSDLNIETASAVNPENVVLIATGSETYAAAFAHTAVRDWHGEELNPDRNYHTAVLALADGVVYNVNTLTVTTNSFKLKRLCQAPIYVFAYDNDNTGNSTDIGLRCVIPANETGIEAYRFYIVPLALAGQFTYEMALQAGEGNFVEAQPTGSTLNLTAGTQTHLYNGNPVPADSALVVFAMSYPDMVYCDRGTVSNMSRPFVLSNPNVFVTGQISGNDLQYNNIEPDVVLNPYQAEIEYELSIDGDSESDVRIIVSSFNGLGGGSSYIKVKTLAETELATCFNNNYEVDTIPAAYNIGNFLEWNSGTFTIAYVSWVMGSPTITLGSWYSTGEKFMALRTQNSNSTTYTWVRVSTNGASILRLYDMASVTINTQSPQPLPPQCPQLYPNPCSDELHLVDENLEQEVNYSITNVLGQLVIEGRIDGENTKIQLNGLTPGLYVLSYINHGSTNTIKFLKQ